MSDVVPSELVDAASLADAFDRSFADTPLSVAEGLAEDSEELLGAAVEGGVYLLRLREMKGLASHPKLVRVGSPMAELVGVMGLRGSVVPVYSLGALLGHPSVTEDAAWVFLVGEGTSLVGLGVKEFTGHLRLPRREIATSPERDGYVRETVRVRDDLRGVIDVRAIVASLQERVRPFSGNQEG